MHQEPLPPEKWRREKLFNYLILFELIPDGDRHSDWYNDPERMLQRVREDMESDNQHHNELIS